MQYKKQNSKKSFVSNQSSCNENPKVLREQFLNGNLKLPAITPKHFKTRSHAEITDKQRKSLKPGFNEPFKGLNNHKLISLKSLEDALTICQTCVHTRIFNLTSKSVTQK